MREIDSLREAPTTADASLTHLAQQQSSSVSPGSRPGGVAMHNPPSGTEGAAGLTRSNATRTSDTVNSPGAWAIKVTGTIVGVRKRNETVFTSSVVPDGTTR